jgi:hypothetical protein
VNAYARIVLALTTVVLGFGVVQAATVSRSPSSPSEPPEALLEREVAAPLRERRLGWELFGRAGPRWDASKLRVVAVAATPDAAGWTSLRLEAPSFRREGTTDVVWLGRRNASSGAIELSRPEGTPQWRRLADVLGERKVFLPVAR